MNSKVVLAFFGGAAISALVTYKITVALCERQMEEEINSVLAEYEERFVPAYDEETKTLSDMTDEEYEASTKEIMRKYCPGTEEDEVKKKNLIFRKPDLNKMPYHTIASNHGVNKEEPDPRSITVLYADDKEVASLNRPFVISIDEFTDDRQDFQKLSLYYWDADDTLSDENEEIIPAVEETIADALTRFGDGSKDPDIVYVRNESLACDYEIVRNYGSYQETILGIPVSENNKKRRMKDDQHISKDD